MSPGFDALREKLINSQQSAAPENPIVPSQRPKKKRKTKHASRDQDEKPLFVGSDEESDKEIVYPRQRSFFDATNDGEPTGDAMDDQYEASDNGNVNHDDTEDLRASSEEYEYEYEDGDDGTGDPLCDYYEAQEEYPNIPIFQQGIADIEAECNKKLVEVQSMIIRHCCDTPAVREFDRRAKDLQHIPKPKTIRVALVGNSGSGKSYAANSFTDKTELAKEGAIGVPVTNVATKLYNASPDQETKYRSKAEFWSREEMTKMFKDLIDILILFHHNRDPSWPKAERQMFQARAKTALELFLSIFVEHPEFATKQAAEAYLAKNKDADIKILAATMAQWCIDILQKRENVFLEDGRLVEYHDAESAKALRKIIDPLMTAKKRSKEPALWPLVRLVSIGIRGSRILLYYTIFDLAGVSDTNQVRVNNTLQCIETCDMAWVVAKGDRICENKAVSGFLERYGERFENNIWVIATRSDEITMKSDTVAQLAEQGCKVPTRYKELTKKTSPLEADIHKRDRRIVRFKDPSDPVRLSLQSEKDTLQRKLDVLDHERFELLVNARNRWLEGNLQDDTRGILPTGMELSVHSISNRHYAAAQGILPIPLPRLTPEMTGVPAFRAHALSEAAPAASQTFYKYIQSQYGVLFQGLDLWANSEYIPNSDALRQVFVRPREDFAATIEGILEAMGNEAREKITEPLAQGRSQWALQAEKEVKKLNKWHWCTIKSFINNYGAHETGLVAFQNWNEKFMEPAIKAIINPKWRSLQFITNAHFIEMEKGLTNMLRTIFLELNEKPDAMPLPLPKFEGVVNGQIAGMRVSLKAHKAAYLKDLANVRLYATKDLPNGFFTAAMRRVYEDCQEDGGTGYKSRVITRFTQMVTLEGAGSPFNVLGERIAQEVSRNARKCALSLMQDFDASIKTIRAAFESMVAERELTATEKPFREELRAYLDGEQYHVEDIKSRVEELLGGAISAVG
ncbi:hypothetical protein LTR17_015698 [Elasticomyces elasticus]|nr:hypothetical protein LTR17_015698 [Elasticomyces elasticus]